MPIPVKTLRALIEGLPDDALVCLAEVHADEVDGMTHVELAGAEMGEDGVPRIVVRVSLLDEGEDEDDIEIDDED